MHTPQIISQTFVNISPAKNSNAGAELSTDRASNFKEILNKEFQTKQQSSQAISQQLSSNKSPQNKQKTAEKTTIPQLPVVASKLVESETRTETETEVEKVGLDNADSSSDIQGSLADVANQLQYVAQLQKVDMGEPDEKLIGSDAKVPLESEQVLLNEPHEPVLSDQKPTSLDDEFKANFLQELPPLPAFHKAKIGEDRTNSASFEPKSEIAPETKPMNDLRETKLEAQNEGNLDYDPRASRNQKSEPKNEIGGDQLRIKTEVDQTTDPQLNISAPILTMVEPRSLIPEKQTGKDNKPDIETESNSRSNVTLSSIAYNTPLGSEQKEQYIDNTKVQTDLNSTTFDRPDKLRGTSFRLAKESTNQVTGNRPPTFENKRLNDSTFSNSVFDESIQENKQDIELNATKNLQAIEFKSKVNLSDATALGNGFTTTALDVTNDGSSTSAFDRLAIQKAISIASLSEINVETSDSSVEQKTEAMPQSAVIPKTDSFENPRSNATIDLIKLDSNTEKYSQAPNSLIGKSVVENGEKILRSTSSKELDNKNKSTVLEILGDMILQKDLVAPLRSTNPDQLQTSIGRQKTFETPEASAEIKQNHGLDISLPTTNISREQYMTVSNEFESPPLSKEDSLSAIPNSNQQANKQSPTTLKQNLEFSPSSVFGQTTGRETFNAKFESREKLSRDTSDVTQVTPVNTNNLTPSIQAQPGMAPANEELTVQTFQDKINSKFGSRAWNQEVGQKLVWMVAGGEQSAELILNPPDLGPLQVVLNINDSKVDASFVSSHLDVREAIEAAAPKLREMMDSAGISLSGFSVSSQSTSGNTNFSQDQAKSHAQGNSKFNNTASDETLPIKATQLPQRPRGAVDTFV